MSNLQIKDSLCYFNNHLFTGWAEEYYPDGNIKSEKYFNSGLQNGISNFYYKNNQLMEEIKPIGKNQGLLILMWYKNGQQSVRAMINCNVANKNTFEVWDKKGNKMKSSFPEFLLFQKNKGYDFGYKPTEKDLKSIPSAIKDSLLKSK